MFSAKNEYRYEEIYQRNNRRLANYAAAQVHNREDAEELANEAMLVLWRKMQEQDILNPDAYVIQILANLIRNFVRRKCRQIETVSFDVIGDVASEEPPQNISDGFPPELSAADKQILIFRIQRKLSFKEISEILGLAESSCRSRFLRAKAKFKEFAQSEKNE